MKIVNPTAKLGENLASSYLQDRGYKIIERNFGKRYGEIDIIALDKDQTLVFVEVKTRRNKEFGEPLEAITPWKLNSIIKTAQYYKLLHPNLPDRLRIDAVSVKILENNSPEIELVTNISGF